MNGFLLMLAVECAHAFSAQPYIPRRGATIRASTSSALNSSPLGQRREALAVLGAGLGLGVLTHATAAEATSTRQVAPVSPHPSSFRLPMAVGLGTCCPCDVRGEGGDDDVSDEFATESVCDATYQQVTEGLKAGYRFIDTASHYNNERSVGLAIADAVAAGTVEREEVLVCTKVWFDDLGYDKTLASAAASNARLSLGGSGGASADIVLIHFPGTIDSVQSPAKNKRLRQETWKALEKLKTEGKVKGIGVSNYVRRHMKELLASCTIKPDVVEMEIHPFNQQPELVSICKDNAIQVVGFSPLAHGDLPVLKNKILTDIAESYDKTVPQVVMRWLLQQAVVPVVKSSSPTRLAQNLETDNFELSSEDMKIIRTLDAGKRVGFDPNLIA